MLSWEKPLVKPMAPGSIFYHISFQSTFICIFTFPIYIIKYQKYIYLIILSLSDLIIASGHEGINNPFIVLVASFLFVCVGAWDFWGDSYWIDTLVLKTEGNTDASLLHHLFLFKGKTNACSRGSRARPPPSWTVGGPPLVLSSPNIFNIFQNWLSWSFKTFGDVHNRSLRFARFPAQNSSCRHSPSSCKPCKIREKRHKYCDMMCNNNP